MCLTEHETFMIEPALTSSGTGLITGFSGEAEHVKKKVALLIRMQTDE